MTAFVTAQCRPRLPGAAGGGGRATCAHSRLTGTKDGTQQEEHLFLPLGTGAVVATFVYDSYGNLVASTGTASTACKYVGNQRYRAEADLGLIWIGCRHYDPGVGRWTTEDTWLGTPGRTQSVNRYVYCEGDAVNLTDASGKSWTGDAWEWIADKAGAIGQMAPGCGEQVLGLGVFVGCCAAGFLAFSTCTFAGLAAAGIAVCGGLVGGSVICSYGWDAVREGWDDLLDGP